MKKRCHYLSPIAFPTSHYPEVQCQDDPLFFKYWDLLPCLVLNLPPKNGAKWQFRKIFYIFLIAGLEPKIFIYRSSSKEQSCRAHKIGQILTPISLLYLFLFKSYRLRKNSLSASSERVKGTQRRILQIWLFSTLPNPQTMTGALCSSLKVLFMDTPHSTTFSHMWFSGRRHCGRQGQLVEEDQRGRWH